MSKGFFFLESSYIPNSFTYLWKSTTVLLKGEIKLLNGYFQDALQIYVFFVFRLVFWKN